MTVDDLIDITALRRERAAAADLTMTDGAVTNGAVHPTTGVYLRARLLLASDAGHSQSPPCARQHSAPTTAAQTPALVGTGLTRQGATLEPVLRR